jgi:hypothetical protein
MYAALYTGYLLLDEARGVPRKKLIARRYIAGALARAHAGMAAIRNGVFSDLASTDEICG